MSTLTTIKLRTADEILDEYLEREELAHELELEYAKLTRDGNIVVAMSALEEMERKIATAAQIRDLSLQEALDAPDETLTAPKICGCGRCGR